MADIIGLDLYGKDIRLRVHLFRRAHVHKAFTKVGQSSGEDDDVTGPVKKQLSISEACNDYYYYVHAVLGTALLLLLIKLNWLI